MNRVLLADDRINSRDCVIKYTFSLTALVSDNDAEEVEIVQHRPEASHPIQVSKAIRIEPPTLWTSSVPYVPMSRVRWEKLQFNKATRNSGKRAERQYFYLQVNLWGLVQGTHKIKERWVRLASCKSENVAVYGHEMLDALQRKEYISQSVPSEPAPKTTIKNNIFAPVPNRVSHEVQHDDLSVSDGPSLFTKQVVFILGSCAGIPKEPLILLVEFLLEDPEMRLLCQSGFDNEESDKFERSLRHLLKRYAVDLNRSAVLDMEFFAASSVRTSSRAAAAMMRTLWCFEGLKFQAREANLAGLVATFRNQLQSNSSIENVSTGHKASFMTSPQEEEMFERSENIAVSDLESSDEDEAPEYATLPNLKARRTVLTSEDAYENLKEGLMDLVTSRGSVVTRLREQVLLPIYAGLSNVSIVFLAALRVYEIHSSLQTITDVIRGKWRKFLNMYGRMKRPSVKQGYKRMEWTCVSLE